MSFTLFSIIFKIKNLICIKKFHFVNYSTKQSHKCFYFLSSLFCFLSGFAFIFEWLIRYSIADNLGCYNHLNCIIQVQQQNNMSTNWSLRVKVGKYLRQGEYQVYNSKYEKIQGLK